MGSKEINLNDEIWLKCKNKKCDKICFKPIGAITHAKRMHGKTVRLDNVLKHYTIVKNPPKEVIEEAEAKRRNYSRKKQKANKGTVEKTSKKEVHYKCNACGHVVRKKISLQGHCSARHNATMGEIGYTETFEPVTSKHRGRRKHKKTPFVGMLGEMPEIIDIPNAELHENGIALTIRIKLSKPFIANVILPTLLPPLK